MIDRLMDDIFFETEPEIQVHLESLLEELELFDLARDADDLRVIVSVVSL